MSGDWNEQLERRAEGLVPGYIGQDDTAAPASAVTGNLEQIVTGLAANRPAANAYRGWYFSSDTGALEHSNGAAWAAPSGTSAPTNIFTAGAQSVGLGAITGWTEDTSHGLPTAGVSWNVNGFDFAHDGLYLSAFTVDLGCDIDGHATIYGFHFTDGFWLTDDTAIPGPPGPGGRYWTGSTTGYIPAGVGQLTPLVQAISDVSALTNLKVVDASLVVSRLAA